ncbi:MAG: PorT family protein [Bacteroidetes bacterium]|nr:MAG: PorT family protein [Bacteroidota bacterium]
MRNQIITFFLLLISFSTFAQKRKLSVELFSNYSVYNFSTSLPPLPSRDLKGRLGGEAEVRYYYTPKEKYAYYIGIGFTKYNYTSGKYDVHYSDQIVPKNGYELPSYKGRLPIAVKRNYSYNYISIPIGVQYAVNKRLSVSAGVKVLRMLSGYGYSKYYYATQWNPKNNFNKKTFDNEGYAKWLVNAHVEAGYILPVLKYNITWKAAFDYALTDYIDKQYPALNLYPYTFSVGASLPLCVSKQ